MKLKQFIAAFILILFSQNEGYAQILKVFLHIFQEDEKKIISLVAKEGSTLKNETHFENPILYDFLSKENKFKNNKGLTYHELLKIINKEVSAGHLLESEVVHLKIDAEYQSIANYDLRAIEPISKETELWIKKHYQSTGELRSIKASPLSLKYISNAQLFMSIPSNEHEFKNIFGNKNFKKSQAKEAVTIKNFLDKEQNKYLHFPKSQELLFDMLNNSNEKEKSFIIIGHNKDGKLYFPDGSSSKLEEIDSIAKKFSRVIIYLSCNASDYTQNPAASYFLTYQEAISLTHRLDCKVPIPLKKNITEVKTSIQKVLDDYGKEKQLSFKLKITGFTTAATGTGYALYRIRSENK